MAGIVSVERAKQAGIVFLIALLAITTILLALGSRDAEAGTPEDIGLEVLLYTLQVDVVCSNRVTKADRIGASVPLIRIIESFFSPPGYGTGFDLEEFLRSCTRYETTRISPSLSGDLLLRFADQYNSD